MNFESKHFSRGRIKTPQKRSSSKDHLGSQHASKGRLRAMWRGNGFNSDGKSCRIKRTLPGLPGLPSILVSAFSGASQGRSEQLEPDPVSKPAGPPLAIHQLEKSPGHPIPSSFLTEATEVLTRNCHRHKVDHFKEHHDILVRRRALKDALEVIIEEEKLLPTRNYRTPLPNEDGKFG